MITKITQQMKYSIVLALFIFGLCLIACQSTQKLGQNPAAPGFKLNESDPKAIAIADEVMLAMGGRKNWDKTRYLVWNFFGARKLTWDKLKGRVRIESQKDDFTVLMNIFTNEGQVKKGNEVFTQPDSLRKYLDKGKNIWINDSYWLVMPFKLKDSGVRLKYLGERETEAGEKADVLELTFQEVGSTPENKYDVYVDKKTRLVNQWDFYSKAENEEARFKTPWQNYQPHGKILLSGDRGGDYQLTEIGVYDKMGDAIFEQF